MVSADEDALICDFAETYHVLDFRSRVPVSLLMQAVIVDRLGLLLWMQTKDGRKNRRRPTSIAQVLLGTQPRSDVQAFDSEDAFWAAIRAADEGK